MKICGLQKVSLVDFDGHVSATIFTSGCNFACPFCHNAGLVKCTEIEIPRSEIMSYLQKRKNVLDAVCISGGEPTINHDLPDFIREIKNLGYLVKLDTNGTNLDMLKLLVNNNLIDYVAMDIKNGLNNYSRTIGTANTFRIKDTIEYIMSCGIDYEFRTTLIDGYHGETDMEDIGKLIHGAKRYYLQKFEDSGNCLQEGLRAIDVATANTYLKIVSQYIKNTQLRGY